MSNDTSPESGQRGTHAIVGALIAVVGAVAAMNPQCAALKVINEAVPQLAQAIPVLVTTCGAIIAALSHPPKFRRS